jgi:hypothetical protein
MFDPSTATWYLRNEVGPGAPDAGVFQYGGSGWIPVVGDWNGDGKTTLGVIEPTTLTWYLRNSNSSGAPDIAPFAYGAPGWIPVAGDWTGGGKTTIGVVDPNAGWFLRTRNSGGAPTVPPYRYGLGFWTPVAGPWDSASSPLASSHRGTGVPVEDPLDQKQAVGVRDLDLLSQGIGLRSLG